MNTLNLKTFCLMSLKSFLVNMILIVKTIFSNIFLIRVSVGKFGLSCRSSS